MRNYLVLLLPMTVMACAAPRAPSPRPETVAPRPTPSAVQPDRFLGLEADQLRALMGRPNFARADGATQMWRYDTPSCRAFFFLVGNPARVGHVATLPEGTASGPDAACLKALHAALPAG